MAALLMSEKWSAAIIPPARTRKLGRPFLTAQTKSCKSNDCGGPDASHANIRTAVGMVSTTVYIVQQGVQQGHPPRVKR